MPAQAVSSSPPASAAAPDPKEVQRLRLRRDGGRWSAVMGFGLMFAGSFHTGLVLGGGVMVLYGVGSSMYWSRRLRRLKGDPWDYDPELDGPGRDDWGRETDKR